MAMLAESQDKDRTIQTLQQTVVELKTTIDTQQERADALEEERNQLQSFISEEKQRQHMATQSTLTAAATTATTVTEGEEGPAVFLNKYCIKGTQTEDQTDTKTENEDINTTPSTMSTTSTTSTHEELEHKIAFIESEHSQVVHENKTNQLKIKVLQNNHATYESKLNTKLKQGKSNEKKRPFPKNIVDLFYPNLKKLPT